jgi:citrate lyase subunit beta / citryl-CoA lyase
MVTRSIDRPADAIVLDLEDSVPINEKTSARKLAAITIANWPLDAGSQLYVRINPPRFDMLDEDLAVVQNHPAIGLVVPKVDLPVELTTLFTRLGAHSRDIIINIETPRALLHAEEFADTEGVGGLFLGGEDLTQALGMRRTSSGDELNVARMWILTASRAAGIAAYDAVCPDFRDLDVVQRDANVASAMGFDGKFAIHPAQLEPITRAFTPSADDVREARRIVGAYDDAVQSGRGAVAVDGRMIDPPVAERARALLARAARS